MTRAPRVYFDISTALRWTGTPVGIVRVQRELAAWAHARLVCVFVFFDPGRQAFRELTLDVEPFLRGEAALDTLGLTSAPEPGRRRTDRIPRFLSAPFLAVTQLRRFLLRTTEKARLTTRSTRRADLIARVQTFLMSAKHRAAMVRPDGRRRAFVPPELALGPLIDFQAGDTLLCTGSGWRDTNIDVVSRLTPQAGVRLVLLCYDLIPLFFPRFYGEKDVRLFRAYMHRALPAADLVVFTARAPRDDAAAYGRTNGFTMRATAIAPLGYDGVKTAPAKGDARPLPPPLERGRFALMVSTIEPRKGHGLLLRVWKRLARTGVLQRHGFKLALAGRTGWMTQDVIAGFRRDDDVRDHTVMLGEVGEALLDTLYAQAAFCVYPSAYEGYGLPVVEAFAHGTPVLCSNGGALAEVAGGLSPCLDPDDEDGWFDLLKQWILQPEARAPFARDIAARFRHPTWAEAAAHFFAAALGDTTHACNEGAPQDGCARSPLAAEPR